MLKLERKKKRARRTRARIKSLGRPRLTVFRSNRYIYAQIIDDAKGKTLASLSSKKLEAKETKDKNLVQVAEIVGEKLAGLAKEAKVKTVTFDRGAYKYHGAVRALADGARKGGLEF